MSAVHPTTPLKVQLVDPKTLKPHPLHKVAQPGRARRASKEFDESIRDHGIDQPIICNQNWKIAAGHERWQAGMAHNMTAVPVISRFMTARDFDRIYFESNIHNSLNEVERANWTRLYIKHKQCEYGGTITPAQRDEIIEDTGASRATFYRAASINNALQEAAEEGDDEFVAEVEHIAETRGLKPAEQKVSERRREKAEPAASGKKPKDKSEPLPAAKQRKALLKKALDSFGTMKSLLMNADKKEGRFAKVIPQIEDELNTIYDLLAKESK